MVLDYVLRPSIIEGVGVYTTKKLRKGKRLRILDDSESDIILISVKKANKSPQLLEMCNRFGILTKKGYLCSDKFNRMYIGWYVNHSKTPNIEMRKNGKHYTLRKIEANEELLLDYSTLDRHIDNSLL